MSDYWRHKVEEHEAEILKDQIDREIMAMVDEAHDGGFEVWREDEGWANFSRPFLIRQIAALRLKTRALR